MAETYISTSISKENRARIDKQRAELAKKIGMPISINRYIAYLLNDAEKKERNDAEASA